MNERDWLVGACALFLAGAASAETTLPDCAEGARDIEILSRQQPYYPHSALMLCLTGWVKTEFVIDERGRTRDVRVLESQPEAIFDRAAIDAIEAWRFVPACRDGEYVEREALQTIEFQLDSTPDRDCPDLGDLDAATVELLGEIGARYALLAEFLREGGSGSELRAALEAPFDDYEGGLSRVAAFHHETLGRLLSRPRGQDVEDRFTDTLAALMPDALADDPHLETARERLDDYRRALEQWTDEARSTHMDMTASYERLQGESGLEAGTLELLVQPFLGDLEAPAEPQLREQLRSIEDFGALIELLETERGHWRIADGRIDFERDEQEEVWRVLWDQMIEHRSALRQQYRELLRSFRDYAD